MTKRNPHTVWDHISEKFQQKSKINNTDSPKPGDDIFWGPIEKKFYDPEHPEMNCPWEEMASIKNYFNEDKKKGSR